MATSSLFLKINVFIKIIKNELRHRVGMYRNTSSHQVRIVSMSFFVSNIFHLFF